jgi:hypothetical protein
VFYRKGGEMKNNFFKITNTLLILSLIFTLGCKKKNKQPETPDIPTGPSNCGISIEYNFTSSAIDPNGDGIAIRFNWGDGDTSGWSAFVPSGDSVSLSHSWSSQGTYFIKAQAKNVSGLLSNWSDGYQIVIIVTWTKTYGGGCSDFGYSVQQTSDNGYIITGYTTSFNVNHGDFYLIKADANGDTVWTKTYGGNDGDFGYSVQQTSDEGYIVAGYTFSFGAGAADVYLIKIDGNGNSIWTKTYGGSNYDYCHSVQQTLDGGFIIAGSTTLDGASRHDVYLIKTDANGDIVFEKTFGGVYDDKSYSAQQTSDGGFIVAGWTNSFGAGNGDFYLIKTDVNGDTIWTKTYGGSRSDWGYSVQQTSDDGYIIAGTTSSFGVGYADIYLIKTDANGDTTWTKTYGAYDDDRGYSVQQTSDGGYIIAGYTYSFSLGESDIYLVKTDANGNLVWSKTYGGIGYDEGYSVQQTLDGGYIIAGKTNSFGFGWYDVCLIKTDGNGNTLPPDTSKMTSTLSTKSSSKFSKYNEFKNRSLKN